MYYFKSDMSGLYLILKVPYDQDIKKKHGRYYPSYLRNKSEYIKKFLEENNKLRSDLEFDIDLANDRIKTRSHNKATIVAKYYDKEKIPSTENLVLDIKYFADLRKFIINNYTDQTEISESEWISVLENKSVIDEKMFSILEIMYNMEDYKATTGQLIEKRAELGFRDEKSYNSTIIGNSHRVKRFLNKNPLYNKDGSENYWMRFFYGKNVRVSKDGKKLNAFQFKLKEELVEALGKVNRKEELVDTSKSVNNNFSEENIETEKVDYMAEEKLFNSFYDYLLERGYLFDKETIENYLLSLKVKPFAILTGNSGTGKTKLSQLFAQYLMEYDSYVPNLLVHEDMDDEYDQDLEVFEEDSDEYITFKTKNSFLKNGFYSLGNKTLDVLLGLYNHDYYMDFTIDGIEATLPLKINPSAKSYDKELLEHLNSLDNLSDVEVKIRKKDLYESFSNEKPGVDKVLDFTRFRGEDIFWSMPYKEWENIINIKNGSFWNAIVDGIETTFKLELYSIIFDVGASENLSLKRHVLQKGLRDKLSFTADLSSLEIYENDSVSDLEKEFGFVLINDNENIIENNSNPVVFEEIEEENSEILCEENKMIQSNYKIIPVGANWTENRHIVGYYNVITNEYQSTPAYDLIKAANNSTEPHFLILDEMNLSHVERYFADFLSAIESGEKIPLYGEEELTLPSNLFIIGTVNVDETTYMFSPKVLDRANVIEFETYSASDYMNNKINLDSPNGNISYLEDPLEGNYIRDYGIDELRDLFSEVSVDGESFWNLLTKEIYQFQTILKESGFDFGFRVINEIVRFMAVAWEYEDKPEDFTNWKRYFDACIKQKLLPKLHGSEKIIGETLDKLYTKSVGAHLTYETANYPESARKLKEMREVLRKQRYVSFIN